MLLRDSNTESLKVYDINSNQITGAAFIGTIGLDWQFSGVGNFSGNPSETDLLLRNNKNGGLEVYDISNNQLTVAALISGAFEIVASPMRMMMTRQLRSLAAMDFFLSERNIVSVGETVGTTASQ